MKKNKHIYKTEMPKAWRKKKSQKRKHQKTVPLKTNSPLLHKKIKQKNPSTWKLPGMLMLAGLFTMMLIIPAFVVVAFGKNPGNDVNITEETNKKPGNQADTEAAGQPATEEDAFSVAVMRSSTERVEDVALEEYVAGVVASEMPADFELEALKAQALSARTYIVNHLLHQDNPEDSDVSDTVQHQVYKNEQELQKLWGKQFETKMKKVKEAVAATEGQILTYENSPITPAFFSTSNGYTENSEDYWDNELPYLRSVKSKWDEDSPKFMDQATFPISQIEATFNISLPHTGQVPVEISRTDSNRVSELKIGGKTFSGRKVREKLQLQSNDFSIKQKNSHLIFTTKGYGHGIGMSQYGANGMAKEGKKYEDIVKHYYKDVEVRTIDDTAPKLVAK